MKRRLFFDKINKTDKPFSQINQKNNNEIRNEKARLQWIPMKFRKS